jgi:hypothetical protein
VAVPLSRALLLKLGVTETAEALDFDENVLKKLGLICLSVNGKV